MTMVDNSFQFPQQAANDQQPEFLWIDQLAQEMLLTAQAFNLLHQAWAGRFMVVPS